MAHETSTGCAFATERLVVGDWHDLADRYGLGLVDVVCGVLTSTTTASLPTEWHGAFDADRASSWVAARDAESPTLLVVERASERAIGLMMLFEGPSERRAGCVDLRLGYVFAESAWGRGFATELVAGLTGWAWSEPSIASVVGGVAEGNEASASVLLKNGFELRGSENGEQVYELSHPREGAQE